MSFDRIEYENQHMTLERFFALINDFKLNEIPVDDNNKQLTHPNNIILIFKKSKRFGKESHSAKTIRNQE